MSIFEQASEDWNRFSQEHPLRFVDRKGFEVSVDGIATKHHINVDTEGQIVNTKNIHVSVSEKSLTDLSYPTRNDRGDVSMKKHVVYFTDSTNVEKKYYIIEAYPDETVGVLTFILEESE